MSPEAKPVLSPDALQRLVDGHRDFLSFLERRVESRAVAEDILQSAFARGLERGTDASDDNVVAWFYRVLRNAVVDHYRRRAAASRAMEAWGQEFRDSTEPDAAVRQEICGCITGLLGALKPEYREALQVVDLGEGALADLARQSGITAENAAVRVHRARKALRRQVEQACGTCAEHGCSDCHCGEASHAACATTPAESPSGSL